MRVDKGIPIRNLFFLLSYALEFNPHDYPVFSLGEACDCQQELLARLLELGVRRQARRGLFQAYAPCQESLSSVRGHISIDETIGERRAIRRRVVCEYDVLSTDNPFNQALKATMLLLLRSEHISRSVQSKLGCQLLWFADVSIVDPKAIRWSTFHYNQANRGYRVLMALCQLVVEGLIMDEQEDEGLASDLSGGKMSKVFERFILNYFRCHWSQLDPAAPRVKWDVAQSSSSALLPVMQTDAVLQGPKRKLIIDAKYYTQMLQYRYDTPKLHSDNIYQLFTYTVNEARRSNREVAGMLLYAKTGELVQPDEDFMLGDQTYYVRSLDLGAEVKSISMQLDAIARLVANE